jgi:hypothetical protein
MVEDHDQHYSCKAEKAKRRLHPGEVNKLVIDLVHPLIRENEAFVLVDELAHGIIEGDIEETHH